MKKLEIKLRHFEELEATMDAERQAVSLKRKLRALLAYVSLYFNTLYNSNDKATVSKL